MDSKEKKTAEHVEMMLERAIPSQIPVHCVKSSYERILLHTKVFNPGPRSVWACEKTGAPIKAKMSWRTIWNRDRTLNAAHMPVMHLFCSNCDKPPEIQAEDPIWIDEIQTLAC